MKIWFQKHWVKVVAGCLIVGVIIYLLNLDKIMNHRITKAKMEILNGLMEKDKEKIQNGMDSMKFHSTPLPAEKMRER